MIICVRLTDEQKKLFLAVARRDNQTIEQWVLSNAWALAQLYADELGVRLDARKSPRRDEGAVPRGVSTSGLVKCPHCKIPTRAVDTCDNCDRSIVS